MTLAHARAVLGHGAVGVEPFEPAHDRLALIALARWATRFSPLVAADPPDGLLMDITGCERLFGGHDRLLERVVREVGHMSFTVRVAVAPTFGCAWAVARFAQGDRVVVAQDGIRQALGVLPIRALRVSHDTQEALAQVGVHRIDQLLALGRSSLSVRFGADLLWRLDQALGQVVEVIQPVRTHQPPRVGRVFDGPVTRLEVITTTVKQLLAVLCRELQRGESGARCVVVQLERIDLQPVCVTVNLGRPSRDTAHLWTLIEPKLERVHMGFGVEVVTVVATQTGRLVHRQHRSWWSDGPENDGRVGQAMAHTLDLMTNRLGAGRVVYAQPVASHLPEQAIRHQPATGHSPHVDPDTVATWWSRPSLLLDRPEPIQVIALQPEGPPVWLCWGGAGRRIVQSLGPERIAAQWWRCLADSSGVWGTRDYFKIQDEYGRWLWVYRQLDRGHWFIHGQWA